MSQNSNLINRNLLLEKFLQDNNIINYEIKKIAGDASFRNYYRIFLPKKTLILMDAPPQYEDVKPFCDIAKFLLDNGFSAPKIFAKDYKNGFLLLEDFGYNSYNKILQTNPKNEEYLYQNAIDLLISLANIKSPKNLPIYDQDILLREVNLFIDWYLPYISKIRLEKTQKTELENIWLELFSYLSKPTTLVLRDYHADNLMLLDNKKGFKNVGLLDFQDALIGHREYDLVSLLEDARRNISQNMQEKMLQYYLSKANIGQDQFLLNYQILSLQRNIKIIGIFTRLAYRDNKNHYLAFLPRVINYIKNNLEKNNIAFANLNNFLKRFI